MKPLVNTPLAGRAVALLLGLLGPFTASLPAQRSAAPAAAALVPSASRLMPNLADRSLERPLRYRPDGADFVIENGGEFFNRPLYGGNTAFRVDAGDLPEFSLYLPGRGGNVRLGLRSAIGAKWLHEAATVIARYRPGEMRYEIRDPLLGANGVLHLTAVALHQSDGLIVRVERTGGDEGVELVWGFGGANGQRGRRDGDIGTENVPIGDYFQLKPEYCRGNDITVEASTFTLKSRTATLCGSGPSGARVIVGDAAQWDSCAALLASEGSESATPVVVGRVGLTAGQPLFLGVRRADGSAAAAEDLDTYREVTAKRPGENAEMPAPAVAARTVATARTEDWPRLFADTQAHFQALRDQVKIETPDPYINAAVGALNVAADAVWDEPQGAIMHGAIAWRTRLLGWRGPYALDALGWSGRAQRNIRYWAGRQNTDPIPEKLPPADADANLARSEAALHSNGDMANSHYDMNTVFIDAVFRHLQWTGDWGFARELWPVIERHLAWERRLFRREFGPEKLPLYEAYAMIWASDDVQYSGGGTAHASSYGYWHNRMAARLARGLGHDAEPYDREASLIARGMRELLWLPGNPATGEAGYFAEFKDLLGRQLVHPSAALWSYYHAIDSEVPTPGEAWQMMRSVDQLMPRLPIRGPGVPADADYQVYSLSNWMPYTWSINNVVMGENVHTALAYWQAGRPEDGFRLMKSALLASMFMGICPGNVGSMNYLDVYRRESQRDFADGSGVLSRTLVEGLFGVHPNALAGELRVAPGFPAAWERATLQHPYVDFVYRRDGHAENLAVTPKWTKPTALRLQLHARGAEAEITVNGVKTAWSWMDGPAPRIELVAAPAAAYDVAIRWTGALQPIAETSAPATARQTSVDGPSFDWHAPGPLVAAFDPVALAPIFNDRVTEIFRPGKYVSPRSPFASLALPAQGIGAWAGHVNATAEIDDRGLRAVATENGGRLVLPNGVPFATVGTGEARNICFVSQWDNYPREVTVPLAGEARHLFLLMAGSTNHMQSRIDNAEVIVAYADGSSSRLALRNPETWWPIEQDYFVDDYQFRVTGALPPRVDLKTGTVRLLEANAFKGRGRAVPGGAATVLELALDPVKELRSLTVRALANEVVVGLMAATLARE